MSWTVAYNEVNLKYLPRSIDLAVRIRVKIRAIDFDRQAHDAELISVLQ
ncbi:hypothetical protein [Chamaesiphon polymorphus]|nr:hypothetical protein [Chamaesiphon polymorphus]